MLHGFITMVTLQYFHFVFISELEDDTLPIRRLSTERLCGHLRARSIVDLFTERRHALGEAR